MLCLARLCLLASYHCSRTVCINAISLRHMCSYYVLEMHPFVTCHPPSHAQGPGTGHVGDTRAPRVKSTKISPLQSLLRLRLESGRRPARQRALELTCKSRHSQSVLANFRKVNLRMFPKEFALLVFLGKEMFNVFSFYL